MKKLMMGVLAAACGVIVCGCQTRITATKNAEQVLPIQKVVEVNGQQQVIVERYQIASGGWEATARSPLYATEGLKGLDLGVETNGTVYLKLDAYSRDLSTNAVAQTEKMFSGGAQLVTAIGDAYVKIAGGGAQAATVLDVAQAAYSYFEANGGDVSKATVTTTDKSVKVSDGQTAIECDVDGNCTTCSE